jgi:hypothetical protein
MFKLSNLEGDVESISPIFTITDSPVSWLTIENTSGTIPAGEVQNNPFTITTAGLEPATYVAVIKVITSIGQLLNIPITLEVYSTIPPSQEYILKQNFPNPFNPFTKIEYDVPVASNVTIKVFNIRGQFVKKLIDEPKEPGSYETYWDGTDNRNRKVSSGIYFYQLNSGSSKKAKKMMLVK